MEVIEISGYRQPQPATRRTRPAPMGRILATAVKAGFFIGTAAMACEAVILAVKFAQARATLPGGEIFTLPLIVALFAAGYALRGDVEAVRRRKRREQRRKAHEQRSQ